MKIEWTKKAENLHLGRAGKLFEVIVAPSDREWLATVVAVSRDWSAQIDYDQALRPTIEEAKQAAQTSIDYALRPFVEAARAEGAAAEREACAKIVALALSSMRELGFTALASADFSDALDNIRARGSKDNER